jgi:deazaflavin-dependent oxidoreductase (nitroreductase family)
MARTYVLSPSRRLLNALIRPLIRVGLAGRHQYLLSVQGRKSGKLYSTPVTLVETGGGRWLVAPYGEVGWVRNARAAGEVRLSRGRHSETAKIEELQPAEAAPVLREYLRRVPVTRPYFDVAADSPIEALEEEAVQHPVFAVRSPAGYATTR